MRNSELMVGRVPRHANLTGAYIDSDRGTLKVTDISPKDYPSSLDIMGEGVYHIYDYRFFTETLKKTFRHA